MTDANRDKIFDFLKDNWRFITAIFSGFYMVYQVCGAIYAGWKIVQYKSDEIDQISANVRQIRDDNVKLQSAMDLYKMEIMDSISNLQHTKYYYVRKRRDEDE